jgi:hypothetical protein
VQYEVLFIGDKTKALLTAHFLQNFERGFVTMAFTKQTKKALKAAITEACRIY